MLVVHDEIPATPGYARWHPALLGGPTYRTPTLLRGVERVVLSNTDSILAQCVLSARVWALRFSSPLMTNFDETGLAPVLMPALVCVVQVEISCGFLLLATRAEEGRRTLANWLECPIRMPVHVMGTTQFPRLDRFAASDDTAHPGQLLLVPPGIVELAHSAGYRPPDTALRAASDKPIH